LTIPSFFVRTLSPALNQIPPYPWHSKVDHFNFDFQSCLSSFDKIINRERQRQAGDEAAINLSREQSSTI
jgi:hypothetical protein